MAKLGFEYAGDTEDLNKNDFDRKPLPDGEYMVDIQNSDYRDNATGTGSYVMVEFQVIDGEHASRKLWANYNIIHTNEQAQEIGQQQFAKLCLATLGKPSCADTDDLIGRQIIVGVGLDKKDPTRNRVKYTNAIATSAPAAPARPAAAARVEKAANPWKKQ